MEKPSLPEARDVEALISILCLPLSPFSRPASVPLPPLDRPVCPLEQLASNFSKGAPSFKLLGNDVLFHFSNGFYLKKTRLSQAHRGFLICIDNQTQYLPSSLPILPFFFLSTETPFFFFLSRKRIVFFSFQTRRASAPIQTDTDPFFQCAFS